MEFLSNVLLSLFLNTTILIVWFLTNAYYEYTFKIFPFLFKNYHNYIKNNSFIYFTEYLENNSTYLNKLLSCPFCIGFWTALISCLIYNCLIYVCVIYIGSLLLFFIIKKYEIN